MKTQIQLEKEIKDLEYILQKAVGVIPTFKIGYAKDLSERKSNLIQLKQIIKIIEEMWKGYNKRKVIDIPLANECLAEILSKLKGRKPKQEGRKRR